MQAPNFWDDQESAQKTMQQLKQLRAVIKPVGELCDAAGDVEALLELAEEDDSSETEQELRAECQRLLPRLEHFEFRATMNGPHDASGAFVTIHAGAGGTESCDWAEMLLRMYSRWIEDKGYEAEMLDIQSGDEAGIRSASLAVRGPYVHGYLRSEIGVHRLVRISPFDANKRRHTSFASVDVVPELDEAIEIEINEKDLRIDTYRASGAGGQHVNKTSSAVRITHLPTGLVVQCQNERSQHQNRRMAMNMLRSRLYRVEEQKREAELARLYGEKGEIAWGNQIRSYVLQPYRMVKDERTGHRTGNVDAVLDGQLDEFIEAYLRWKLGQSEQ